MPLGLLAQPKSISTRPPTHRVPSCHMRRCLLGAFLVISVLLIICTVGLNAEVNAREENVTHRSQKRVTVSLRQRPAQQKEEAEQSAGETVGEVLGKKAVVTQEHAVNLDYYGGTDGQNPEQRQAEFEAQERKRMLKEIDPPDEQACPLDMLRKTQDTRFWVYSMISNFPGSANMLRHWIIHYLSWGVRPENFLIICHSSKVGVEASYEFGNITKILNDHGIKCINSSVDFSSESKLKALLEMFQNHVKSPHDWAAYIDSDEFSDFGPQHGDVYDAIRDLEANGHNALLGRLVDRVTSTGELRRIRAFPTVWEQFPLQCDMRTNELIRLMPRKVMMFKNYLRPNTGNHRVISPLEADAYFGPQPEGRRGARYGYFGGEDMRHLTPYKWYERCYQTKRDGNPNHSSGEPWFKMPDAPEEPRNVFHFKWHHGVVENAAKRLEWYKGNVTEDSTGNMTGVPRWAHWWESAKILEWATTGFVPMNRAVCQDDAEANARWKKKVLDAHLWEMKMADEAAKAAKAAAEEAARNAAIQPQK